MPSGCSACGAGLYIRQPVAQSHRIPAVSEAIEAFLTRKWQRELNYGLIKALWAFRENRIPPPPDPDTGQASKSG